MIPASDPKQWILRCIELALLIVMLHTVDLWLLVSRMRVSCLSATGYFGSWLWNVEYGLLAISSWL